MRDDQRQFLMLLAQGRGPARLNFDQAAWVLNCQRHDIPTLIAARLLKPLGNPPRSGTKYFGTKRLLELADDEGWLSKVTNAIHEYWRWKNGTEEV